MKRFRIGVFAVFVLLQTLIAARGWAIESMAVFGPRSKGIDRTLAIEIFTALEEEVIQSGRFQVMRTKEAMETWKKADTDFEFQCRNPLCMVVIAKELGVEKIILPYLGIEEERMKLVCRVFEEVSGKFSHESDFFLSEQGWRSDLNTFIKKLIAEIPFVGKITSIENETVRFDIGSSQGVPVDKQFKVFRFKDVLAGKRYLFKDDAEVGVVQIINLEKSASTAVITSTTKEFTKGDVVFVKGVFPKKAEHKVAAAKNPLPPKDLKVDRKTSPQQEAKPVKKETTPPPSKQVVQAKKDLRIYDAESKRWITKEEAQARFGIQPVVKAKKPTPKKVVSKPVQKKVAEPEKVVKAQAKKMPAAKQEKPEEAAEKEKLFGILNIKSNPPGATIYLDEKESGVTPKMISEVASGKRKLRLELEGYEIHVHDVDLKSDERLQVDISLTAHRTRLEVGSVPPGASLYLDGKPKGKTGEVVLVSPGEHKLEIRKKGYSSKSKVVNIAKGEKVSLLLELKRKEEGPPGMVFIPAGEFLMGSSDGDLDEEPKHKVFVDAFYIDKYEVTNDGYRKFLKETGRIAPDFLDDADLGNAEQPVVGITFEDAAAYAQWIGKRLPTEAEWEKAARGTDGRIYPWGNEFNAGKANANGEKDGFRYPAPVNKFQAGASPYGVLNMSGNVWEWCADFYQEDYYADSPKKNPKGPGDSTLKVIRGGSWDNGSSQLNTSNRSAAHPDTRRYDLGFRCAK